MFLWLSALSNCSDNINQNENSVFNLCLTLVFHFKFDCTYLVILFPSPSCLYCCCSHSCSVDKKEKNSESKKKEFQLSLTTTTMLRYVNERIVFRVVEGMNLCGINKLERSDGYLFKVSSLKGGLKGRLAKKTKEGCINGIMSNGASRAKNAS